MNLDVRHQEMIKDHNIQAFFELLRAGLWEKEARLSQFIRKYYRLRRNSLLLD